MKKKIILFVKKRYLVWTRKLNTSFVKKTWFWQEKNISFWDVDLVMTSLQRKPPHFRKKNTSFFQNISFHIFKNYTS